MMDGRDDAGPLSEQEEDRLKKIEEELAKLGGTKFAEPVENDGEARLAAIEAQARAAKQKLSKHTAEGSTSNYIDSSSGKGLGKGLQIAYAILGVPLVGFAIGLGVDHFVGGVFWRGILTIAGAAIAIWYAVKSANSN